MRRLWHPLLDRAGLPRFGFHVLRHTHASLLLASGASVREVADRLGHSRASTTLDVYSHSLPGAGRGLADRMDALMAPGR